MGNMLWKLGLLVQSALLVGCLSGNGFKPFGKESNSQDQTSTSSQNETPGEANLTGPNLGSPEGNSPGENSTNPPAPAPAPTPAPVPTPVCKSTPVMKKGQRMLGFWGSAMAGVGKGDYIAEVAPLSNVVFIHDANINQVKAKLAKAARHKVSAIVSIEPFVYPWRDTRPHSDYKKRLDEFWLALSCNEKKHVAGFYIYDEPYWRNDLTTKIPWQQVKANLEKLIGHLKVLAPGRATSLTLTHFTVNRTNLQDYIPSNLDLFGVNCYLDFGAVCSEPEIVGMFSKMLQAKKPQQKLFMTMDLFSGKPPSASFDLALVQRIRFWKRLMAPHLAEVQALMPFIYQNHPNDNVYGGESLPNSLSETQIYLEAHQGKLKCLGNDLVRIDSKGSIIDRWVNAPMCVPVCEGRDSVRRDALGKEIDRWPSAPHCQ